MGFGHFAQSPQTKPRGLETNLHEINFSNLDKTKFSNFVTIYPFFLYSKFDFVKKPCYNIYIRDTYTYNTSICTIKLY